MTDKEELQRGIRESVAFLSGLSIPVVFGMYYINNYLGNLQPQTIIAIITTMILIPAMDVCVKIKKLKDLEI